MERGFRSGHIVVTREISYRALLEETSTPGIPNIEAGALAKRLDKMDDFAIGLALVDASGERLPDRRKST